MEDFYNVIALKEWPQLADVLPKREYIYDEICGSGRYLNQTSKSFIALRGMLNIDS